MRYAGIIGVLSSIEPSGNEPSEWAEITAFTGDPVVHEYTDSEGSWLALEFTGSGTVTRTEGRVQGALIGPGGPGATGREWSVGAGGGGAGDWVPFDLTLDAGTDEVAIGAAGLPNITQETAPGTGTPTTWRDLVAIPGGHGGKRGVAAQSGASGGGIADSNGGANGPASGTGITGNPGGGPRENTSIENPGAGGGGAGSAGVLGIWAGQYETSTGGAGGAGITSSLTGSPRVFCAGGRGVGPGDIGGVGQSGTFAQAGADGSGSGGDGGMGYNPPQHTGAGKGGDGNFIIRVRVA